MHSSYGCSWNCGWEQFWTLLWCFTIWQLDGSHRVPLVGTSGKVLSHLWLYFKEKFCFDHTGSDQFVISVRQRTCPARYRHQVLNQLQFTPLPTYICYAPIVFAHNVCVALKSSFSWVLYKQCCVLTHSRLHSTSKLDCLWNVEYSVK